MVVICLCGVSSSEREARRAENTTAQGNALGLERRGSTKPCEGAINSSAADDYRALSGLRFRRRPFSQGVALGCHI